MSVNAPGHARGGEGGAWEEHHQENSPTSGAPTQAARRPEGAPRVLCGLRPAWRCPEGRRGLSLEGPAQPYCHLRKGAPGIPTPLSLNSQ